METVILLSQQKPDDHIEIDLDLDELDVTAAETKATYQEIQEYVFEKYGLKVSNLYISQVKKKLGWKLGRIIILRSRIRQGFRSAHRIKKMLYGML